MPLLFCLCLQEELASRKADVGHLKQLSTDQKGQIEHLKRTLDNTSSQLRETQQQLNQTRTDKEHFERESDRLQDESARLAAELNKSTKVCGMLWHAAAPGCSSLATQHCCTCCWPQPAARPVLCSLWHVAWRLIGVLCLLRAMLRGVLWLQENERMKEFGIKAKQEVPAVSPPCAPAVIPEPNPDHIWDMLVLAARASRYE